MVFSKERKFVTKRLHVKTPTLKYGMYDRRSIPDVIRHSELYWSRNVGHDPIKFVGSREVYVEMNMQYQAFSKKRLEQQQLRDFAAGCASLRARRGPGPVARPIDYIFTGKRLHYDPPGERLTPYSSYFPNEIFEGAITGYLFNVYCRKLTGMDPFSGSKL